MATGRRERKKAANRTALLNAARALFSSKGIYSTTIEDVTEASDLAKGTFYSYFSSRDALIAELVRETLCDLVDHAVAAAKAAEETDVATHAIIEAHARFFLDRPDTVLLLHQARGWAKLPSEADSEVRKEFKLYVERLAGILSAAEGRRSARPTKRLLATARALAGCIAGVLSFQRITADSAGRPGDLSASIRSLVRLLAPATGGHPVPQELKISAPR